MFVEVFKRQHYLSSVKSRPVFAESNLVTQVVKQLSSVKKITHEVQLLCVLECKVQLHDERVGYHLHDVSLYFCVPHLLCSYNLVLFQRLHRINCAI